MTRINLVPHGFPVRLEDCPSGHFLFNESICFKNDYAEFFLASGDSFWGGCDKKEDVMNLIVQPLIMEVE